MAALLAPVAGVALASAIDDVRQCQGDMALTVNAAPEIAPALADHVQQWSPDPIEGACIAVEVVAVDSASVAAAYADAHGLEVDFGEAEITPIATPDVWITESPAWLARLGDEGIFRDRVDSVAESAVGLATPADEVETETEDDTVDSPMLAETAVEPLDPHADSASLTMLMGSGDEAGVETNTLQTESGGAVPTSAAAVAVHNMENSEEPLSFQVPQPEPEPFTYPYLTSADVDSVVAQAANAFRSSLLGTEFTALLGDYDLSPAGPYPDVPDAEAVEAALQAWGD